MRDIAFRYACIGTALAVVGWSLLHAFSETSNERGRLSPEQIAESFCAPIPAAARVDTALPVDHPIAVDVPPVSAISNPNLVLIPVRQGDTVQFHVHSLQSGAIGVHGLSDIVSIHAGQTVSLTMRAIYTGRFPLHFHGTDGSHFELAAMEVSGERPHLAYQVQETSASGGR